MYLNTHLSNITITDYSLSTPHKILLVFSLFCIHPAQFYLFLLKNFDIAVIASSLNGKKCKNILDFILKWFDKRFKLYGDGIVSLNSQLSFKEPKKIFSANHISILKDSKKMIQKEIEKEKGRL